MEEISRHKPEDDPLMAQFLALATQPLIAKCAQEHEAQQMRDIEFGAVVGGLPYKASDFEKGKVRQMLRQELERIPASADRDEVRSRMQRATSSIRRGISARIEGEELQSQKQRLVQEELDQVWLTLRVFYREGEIDEDLSENAETVKEAREDLRSYLRSELTGGETAEEVREMSREFLLDWV